MLRNHNSTYAEASVIFNAWVTVPSKIQYLLNAEKIRLLCFWKDPTNSKTVKQGKGGKAQQNSWGKSECLLKPFLKKHTKSTSRKTPFLKALLTVHFSHILAKQNLPFEKFAKVYCMQLYILPLTCVHPKILNLHLQQKMYQCLNESLCYIIHL